MMDVNNKIIQFNQAKEISHNLAQASNIIKKLNKGIKVKEFKIQIITNNYNISYQYLQQIN